MFDEFGTLERQTGSGGSNKISKAKVKMINWLALNKHRRGVRKVGAMVGTSFKTVHRVLKKAGARPYHKRKVQAMTEDHKARRVAFATWALKEYGLRVNGNTTWGDLSTRTSVPWSIKMEV